MHFCGLRPFSQGGVDQRFPLTQPGSEGGVPSGPRKTERQEASCDRDLPKNASRLRGDSRSGRRDRRPRSCAPSKIAQTFMTVSGRGPAIALPGVWVHWASGADAGRLRQGATPPNTGGMGDCQGRRRELGTQCEHLDGLSLGVRPPNGTARQAHVDVVGGPRLFAGSAPTPKTSSGAASLRLRIA